MELHVGMPPSEDEPRPGLSEVEGVREQETAVQAAREAASSRVRRDKVAALSAQARGRYADLLDRLGK